MSVVSHHYESEEDTKSRAITPALKTAGWSSQQIVMEYSLKADRFRIPIADEAEHVKRLVHAPEGYEFTCFLAIGYAAKDAHICRQKVINVADRIHHNVW